MNKDQIIKSVLAGFFSAITIGVLTLLTYKTELGVFLIASFGSSMVLLFGYQCKSCIYCQASVSLLSRKSINKSINSIKELLYFVETFFEKDRSVFPKKWSVFNKLFDKKNISRKECLMLPFKTLSKALKL